MNGGHGQRKLISYMTCSNASQLASYLHVGHPMFFYVARDNFFTCNIENMGWVKKIQFFMCNVEKINMDG